MITADHGNADEMVMRDNKSSAFALDEDGRPRPKTSHTLNPVPFYFYDNVSNGAIRIAGGRSFGLSNVAASTVNLLGYEAPEMWDAGIFDFEKYVR